MMKHATMNRIESPCEGWSLDGDGKMSIDYFDGDPFPKHITDLTPQSDDEDINHPMDSTSSEDYSEHDYDEDWEPDNQND